MNETDLNDFIMLVEDYVTTGFRRGKPVPGKSGEDGIPVFDSPGIQASPDTGLSRLQLISKIDSEIRQCSRCVLHETRNQAVPGEGSSEPTVMIIGEGPGRQEDLTGRPFVGRAGQYLDRWLNAVKWGQTQVCLDRKTNIYITNLVKCHPPENRDPLPGESEACLGYLERQIEILAPRAILTVSRFAAQTLTGISSGIGALRGRTYQYRGIPVIPTYHPSAVLRDSSLRAPVWEDLKALKTLLETD